MIPEARLSPLGQEKIEVLIDEYLAISASRDRRLFADFLHPGLRLLTLSSVEDRWRDDVLLAKMTLATLIVLYDDLADNPTYRDSELLSRLYRINVTSPPEESSGDDLRGDYRAFSGLLLRRLQEFAVSFPNGRKLLPVLAFDIEQFYLATRYAELVSDFPEVASLGETRALSPHNMGFIAFGTIDLMATCDLRFEELGRCREVFHLGQRVGRISNTLATYDRELREGDRTNEIMVAAKTIPVEHYRHVLLVEIEQLLAEIETNARGVTAFDVKEYGSRLRRIHELHLEAQSFI